MAPNADSCEELERLKQPVPVHGRRVLPEHPAAIPSTRAWLESERLGKNHKENQNLLGKTTYAPKEPAQGLKRSLKTHAIYRGEDTKGKSRFQVRKEKLLNVLKPPYFILTVIIIIVTVHAGGGEGLQALLDWAPGAWGSQPWRALTYSCLHANSAHLALNAVVALAVGWRLELEQGWWRVALVWAGGVLAGAAGAALLQPQVRVVGASAAVYALLTAHLANAGLRCGHVPLCWFRPLSVLVLGASEACWALTSAEAPQPGSRVAWAAHALGAAVGLPLAFVVFTGENSPKNLMLGCRVASAALLVGGAVFVSIHFFFWDQVPEHL